MILADKILLEYRVTEKAANLSAHFNQYTFEVAPTANRIEVARAVAKTFQCRGDKRKHS
jgi:large subunit ribosomal protein L23